MVQATGSLPQVAFQVAFAGTRNGQSVSANPNDPSIIPTWTDLTSRLTALQTRRGKSYELDQVTAAEHQFTLTNADGALDPTNTASPFYPYVVPFRQYRLLVTIDGTQYTASTGFIESWPMTWKHQGMYGWVTVLGVDAIAALSQIVLTSCLKSEVLLDAPYGYWPLDEGAPTTQGASLTQTGCGPIVATQYGSGGTCTFGGTTLTSMLGAGAAVTSTGNSLQGNTTAPTFAPTDATDGIALECDFPGATVNTTQLTLECWVATTAKSIRVLAASDAANDYALLSIDSGGYLHGACTAAIPGSSSTITAAVASTKAITDGLVHHVCLTGNASGTDLSVSLYVDGALVNTATSAPTTGGVFIPLGVSTGGQVGVTNPQLGAMTVGHVAIYETALTATRVADHYHAGVDGFPETSGARFTRILGYAPWNLGSVVPAGDTNLMGCIDIDGKSALSALLDVCTWENGNMFANNLGQIVFENRHARMTQLTQAYVMGEGTGPGSGFEPVTVTDNGDGTFTLSGSHVMAQGDGSWFADGSNLVDNGDGTFTGSS